VSGAGLAVPLALALGGLPAGAVRYRVELAGEPVGVVDLSVRCGAGACRAAWDARLRGPEEAGGRVARRAVEVDVDADGRYRGGTLRVEDGSAPRAPAGVPGAVPATVAELVLLSALGSAGEACAEVFDEATGERGRACARRDGATIRAEMLGVALRLVPSGDGFPAEVGIAEQGARYVRDPAARVPARPPRLHGTEVPGPASPANAAAFCGVERDPAPGGAPPPTLPPPAAPGESCREKTARWITRAEERGFAARTAVGVAWDGGAWVWHAWAEARVGGRWLPVDPSFGQSPARGPRFTIARYGGDAAERLRAGRRILACWGRARVEPVR
jgi:hypothetical protein